MVAQSLHVHNASFFVSIGRDRRIVYWNRQGEEHGSVDFRDSRDAERTLQFQCLFRCSSVLPSRLIARVFLVFTFMFCSCRLFTTTFAAFCVVGTRKAALYVPPRVVGDAVIVLSCLFHIADTISRTTSRAPHVPAHRFV